MKPSWNDAPDWANVLLVNKSISGLYAFAEEYEDDSKFKRNDYYCISHFLIKNAWDIIEYRPEPMYSPKTREWQVGDKFTFGNGPRTTDYGSRTITYLGKDRVCYLIPANDQEVCIPKDTFMREAKLYVEKSGVQRDFEEWYERKHGPLVWNPVMKLYLERDPNLAWDAWKEATNRQMFT